MLVDEGLTVKQAVGKAEGMYDSKWQGPKKGKKGHKTSGIPW